MNYVEVTIFGKYRAFDFRYGILYETTKRHNASKGLRPNFDVGVECGEELDHIQEGALKILQ